MSQRLRFGIMSVLAFCLCVLPVTTFAHLASGEDKTIGSYLVDFGYEPATPQAGQRTAVAFNLVDNESAQIVQYDYAWVRISQGNDIFFSGQLYPQNGNVTFSALFPRAGEFEIEAVFYVNDAIVVESSFMMPVQDVDVVPTEAGVASTDGAVAEYSDDSEIEIDMGGTRTLERPIMFVGGILGIFSLGGLCVFLFMRRKVTNK